MVVPDLEEPGIRDIDCPKPIIIESLKFRSKTSLSFFPNLSDINKRIPKIIELSPIINADRKSFINPVYLTKKPKNITGIVAYKMYLRNFELVVWNFKLRLSLSPKENDLISFLK